MYTCASCSVLACNRKGPGERPKNCPMHDRDIMREALDHYRDGDAAQFFKASAAIEAEGYCRWPRLRETAEFCRKMGYRNVGVGFCMGLRKEANVIAKVLRDYGIEVVSVICKAGGIPKQDMGIDELVRPGTFEPICNPVAQALFLNKQKCQFAIAVGLCVGHDSLFYRHCEAPVTTLIAKDRALAHNPAGAVYCAESYFRQRLSPDDNM